MNDIEKKECELHLGTSDGVTMEDYFDYLEAKSPFDKDMLKKHFKVCYENETNWSF